MSAQIIQMSKYRPSKHKSIALKMHLLIDKQIELDQLYWNDFYIQALQDCGDVFKAMTIADQTIIDMAEEFTK